MRESGGDNEGPRRPVGGRLRRHGLSVVLPAAMSAVFLIAAWTTFAWPPRRPSESDAMVWTAAAAAIATLAAVWASLWNADEASRNADEASRNADTALRIARENAEREDEMRHEAVRPIVTIDGTWEEILESPPQPRRGRLRLRVIHEQGLTGFNVNLFLLPQQPGSPSYLRFGDILRPQSGRTTYLSGRPNSGDGLVIYDSGESDLFGKGTRWWIICRMSDVYGGYWEQRSDTVQFINTSLDMPHDGWPLTVRMNMPVRVDGPLIDELKPPGA